MIYLDSAATTLQKPPSVRRAVANAMEHMASPGRGGHNPAMLAADTAFACRQAAAELFHLEDPGNVVFTLNATHALNLAIKSVVKPGDTVVVSGYEHNAVTRPLAALGCRVKTARAPLFRPDAMLEAFEEQLTPEVTRLQRVRLYPACGGGGGTVPAQRSALYPGRVSVRRMPPRSHG